MPVRGGESFIQPTFYRDFTQEFSLSGTGIGPDIRFTRTGTATRFNQNGILETVAANVPRFDYDPITLQPRGLLIEEGRTNSIRNSQGGGSTNGVIGSGGVRPTFWEGGGPTGTTTEIIGTGTTNGLSWVDIKVSGTNTSGSIGYWLLRFDPPNQVAASSGQTWSASFYAAIVGGSISGLSQGPAIHVQGTTSPATFRELTTVAITLTSSLQRFTATRTLNNAFTDRVNTQIYAEVADGNTIDITVRLAAPQLEQGAFATSYIPTTNAAVTRGADFTFVTPVTSFYNQDEGTLFGEASYYGKVPTNFVRLISFGNLNTTPFSDPDRFFWGLNNDTTTAILQKFTNGVNDFGTSFSMSPNTIHKAAIGIALNNARSAANGSLLGVSNDTSVGTPSNITHLNLGGNGSGSTGSVGGHIRKVGYWPVRLSNFQLQQLTR